MGTAAPLLILGCGFAGVEAGRLALAAGREVIATTRSAARAEVLAGLGFDARVTGALSAEGVAALVPRAGEVLVGFPPDGATDAAIATALGGARAIVYLSSTGVYGDAVGRIDETTAVDRVGARAVGRLAAEEAYRAQGAVILRAAAIYGPERGLHLRLLRGEHRVTGDGGNVVSRIHVTDLARLALAALAALGRGEAGATFVVGDDAPVPQLEVIEWLAARLGVAVPASRAAAEVHETLRHDRSVDGGRVQRALGVSLLYPSYREGFAACLAAMGRA